MENVGNGVGLLIKETAPAKEYILWALTDDKDSPNYYEIYAPIGDTQWEKLFKDGFDSASLLWNISTTYAIDDIVIYDFKVWRSLQNSNTGNTPVAGPIWSLETKSVGVQIPVWTAGVYGAGSSIVAYDDGGGEKVYRKVLDTALASTNFSNELLLGYWEELGSGSGGGVAALPYEFIFEENFTQPAYLRILGGAAWAAAIETLADVFDVSYRTRLAGSSTWVSHASFAALVTYAQGQTGNQLVVETTATPSFNAIVGFVTITL